MKAWLEDILSFLKLVAGGVAIIVAVVVSVFVRSYVKYGVERYGAVRTIVVCAGGVALLCVGAYMIYHIFGAVRVRRFSSRKRRHLCVRCGYDLRGIVTNQCPECGTLIDSASRAGSPERRKSALESWIE